MTLNITKGLLSSIHNLLGFDNFHPRLNSHKRKYITIVQEQLELVYSTTSWTWILVHHHYHNPSKTMNICTSLTILGHTYILWLVGTRATSIILHMCIFLVIILFFWLKSTFLSSWTCTTYHIYSNSSKYMYRNLLGVNKHDNYTNATLNMEIISK